MTKYPTIRATMDELTKHLSFDFHLVYDYSGAHDSGWFDGFSFTNTKGESIESVGLVGHVHKYVQENNDKIEQELYAILESRFPGWEIGCDDVNGSSGRFIIKSNNSTIHQEHEVNYNSTEDVSPDEVEKF